MALHTFIRISVPVSYGVLGAAHSTPWPSVSRVRAMYGNRWFYSSEPQHPVEHECQQYYSSVCDCTGHPQRRPVSRTF